MVNFLAKYFWRIVLRQSIDLLLGILNNRRADVTLIFALRLVFFNVT